MSDIESLYNERSEFKASDSGVAPLFERAQVKRRMHEVCLSERSAMLIGFDFVKD